MGKQKPRMVMIGICTKCGSILVRSPPVDTAVCICQSAVEVPLVPYVQITLKLAKDILENPAIPIIILPKRRKRRQPK